MHSLVPISEEQVAGKPCIKRFPDQLKDRFVCCLLIEQFVFILCKSMACMCRT
jgi:hypothetical protein